MITLYGNTFRSFEETIILLLFIIITLTLYVIYLRYIIITPSGLNFNINHTSYYAGNLLIVEINRNISSDYLLDF